MGDARYITHTSHTSHRAAKLYSGVQRIDCKTRRRKGHALKKKLQQARQASLSVDLDPWLNEVIPVAEVDIVEPEVLVQVEGAHPESTEKQVAAGVLPLLQTKFPHATEHDAELVAPLFDSSKPLVTLSSEAPLKYLIMPLLLGSPKVMLLVSSSSTRRASFLYSINTRRRANGSQKSYGIHWNYRLKSLSEYVPFADISYYCSAERIEACRRALWKNLPRAMADMIDTEFVSAIAVSYQDFLSNTFRHFLSLLKTTLHQVVLDWDSRFRDIALEQISALCNLVRQIVVIERVVTAGPEAYTHLKVEHVHASTFSEGVRRFSENRRFTEMSSILCVVDSVNILHPNKNTVMENGILCIDIQTLLETWYIEYLALSVEYEPFDLTQIDTLLLGCIAIPTERVIDKICLHYGCSALRGLTSVIQIVSVDVVFRHINRLLVRNITLILYGSLIANLLSSQLGSITGNSIALSFQRLKSQLTFLTGLAAPPLEACLWWDAVSSIAASLKLCLHGFGQELYTYKLLGSMKQVTIERKYPVCQCIKQACELSNAPDCFTVGTLLCLLSSSTPDGVPLDYAGLEGHLAIIHDAESQVVCCPRYDELPPCILFSQVSTERSGSTSISGWYITKVLEALKLSLSSLATDLAKKCDEALQASVYSEYANFNKHARTISLGGIWRERVSAIQQTTGKEYNPIAACVSLLAEDSADGHPLHAISALKISLDYAADQCNPFTEAAGHIMWLINDFFTRLIA